MIFNIKDIFIFVLECCALALLMYCIYREKDIAKCERQAWFYTKAFFKALFYTVRDFVKDFLKAFRAIF